ncbi:minor capsid protein [Actinokineospora sp.]|uniref:minor capsid protein n=1 Tax=Actinokineospora sp. TaxID=1872133 RepID=UPI003D6BCCAB
MTLTEEFAQLLEDLGLGDYRADGSIGGTIFLGPLPQDPDLALGVQLYGGPESDSLNSHDEPGLQIKVRGPRNDYRVGEAKAQAVYDLLHGLGRRDLVGGTWLQLAVGVNAGPAPMGRDSNDRPEWVVNFRADIDRPTANRP